MYGGARADSSAVRQVGFENTYCFLAMVAVAGSGNAVAHGDKTKHSIVMSSASDLNFDLVNSDGKAMISVEDYGKPTATSGATGKLTVLTGRKKRGVFGSRW